MLNRKLRNKIHLRCQGEFTGKDAEWHSRRHPGPEHFCNAL